MPLTTYAFANAGNAAAGGATFTTDSNGLGLNDSANWSAANYFSATVNYWSRRSTSGTTTAWSGPAASTCVSFGSALSSQAASIGASGNTNEFRWGSGTAQACNSTLSLICYVNP